MRIAITFVLVTVAVLAQATVINRLPFDWNAGPDLVVATVVAVALTTSPAAAAGTGFAAGLAIDVMPPAEHPVGRYTLVLCLAAYLVALLYRNTGATGGRISFPTALGVTAVTTLAVGLGYAAIGLVMGDPRMELTGTAYTVGTSTLVTALITPLVTLPILRLREHLTDSEFTTVQGPTSVEGW